MMIRFVSLLCCLSATAGDQYLHRRRESELIISDNTFEASFEILLDLQGIDEEPVVEHLAFGNGALNAIQRSVLQKVTEDNECMFGVEATEGEIDFQEIGEPQNFDSSIFPPQGDRELQNGIPQFHSWLRLVAYIEGQCQYCGNDNGDVRRLEMARESRTLQDDPAALQESCSKLAKEIITSAGSKHPLLANVQRIGIKFFNPYISVEEPITAWWPSPPEESQ